MVLIILLFKCRWKLRQKINWFLFKHQYSMKLRDEADQGRHPSRYAYMSVYLSFIHVAISNTHY